MSGSSDHKHRSASIEAEASAWIVQLDSGAMSYQDIAAFREWCSRSPVHAEAVRVAADAWGNADILNVLAEPIHAELKLERAPAMGHRKMVVARSVVALAAMCVVAIVGWGQLRMDEPTQTAVAKLLLVETHIGEHLVRVLSDGSTITLNTDTQVEVDFDDNSRRVRILTGEALFEVAHDTARPFIVYADGETVRAVGTAFVVRVSESGVEVMVTEGVVEYAPLALLSAEPAIDVPIPVMATGRLEAGQSIQLGTVAPAIQPVSKTDIRRTLAWTDGMLMFSGESLEEVIAELSRYTTDVVVFDDEATRKIKVGGVFEIGNMDTLWEALETSFEIDVEIESTGEIHLSSAAG